MSNLIKSVFLLSIMLLAAPLSLWATDAEMDEFEAWERSLAAKSKNTNFGSQPPTTDVLIKSLTPIKTRGLAVNQKINTVHQAVSMEVNFPSSSYKLDAKTKKLLDFLGEALNAEQLRGFKFVVEGHTDASGDESYNLKLSEKRSKSVRNYLQSKHGILPQRLEAIGKGEKELLDEKNPNGHRNRRVRIINIGKY
jgi:outer membrane protein OmpA-like peptidoglycan-associated protein